MNCKLLSALLVPATAVSILAQQPAPDQKVDAPVKVAQGKEVAPPDLPTKSALAPTDALPPNEWFPVTEQDLGTHPSTETAIGHFTFQNPTNAAVQWLSLIGSCQCSKALIAVGDRRYRLTSKPNPNQIMRITGGPKGETEEKVSQIEVGPGEKGDVEVHMELGGIAGPRQATLDIHTNDSKTPMMKLRWHAVGSQLFVISPSEVNLNSMVWSEKRDFSVTVRSPLKKDFNITRLDPPGEDFTVKYTKALDDQGVATWTIDGTYAPHSAEVVGGGVLKFYTDLEGQASFQVHISAAITGPLEVKPSTFLSLGLIRKGQKRTEKITFEPNDGTDLDAAEIRFERITLDPKFVVAHKTKEGKKLIIELEITADAPPGLVRGDMVVDLNHPAIKQKKILFNGFIR